MLSNRITPLSVTYSEVYFLTQVEIYHYNWTCTARECSVIGEYGAVLKDMCSNVIAQ